jgi:2-oxoisovalerate dehydrogenase E1 component
VHRALEAAEILQGEGIDAEVIDLRTIQPLDVETVAASVTRTHRLLVVDEGWGQFGVGAELAQAMHELAFDQLDGPVGRLHTEPVPHPFAPALERAMTVDSSRVVEAARSVMAGNAPKSFWWRGVGAGMVAPVAAPAATKPAAPLPPAVRPADGEPITMPFGDLTVSSGKILRWLKDQGDRVQAGETLVEVETDKAVVEIEAPASGTLARIEELPGTMVQMGQRIGVVRPA